MNYVEINETNAEDFSSVLPKEWLNGWGVSVGAVEEGDVCGAVCLSYNGEEYLIDWLYVVPPKRRLGVARGMIAEARDLVFRVGIAPIRMMVNASDENGMYAFVTSLEGGDLPAVTSYSHDRYVISTKDFRRSPAVKEVLKKGNLISSYQTMFFWNMEEAERANTFLLISDSFYVCDEKKFMDGCEKPLCMAVKSKEGTEAVLLVEREDEQTLLLSYLYARQAKALAYVFQELYALLSEYETPQTIYFEPVTKESRRLAEHLFPDAEKEPVYEVEL